MFSSCHARVPELIHTLYLPECQGTPCWKQVRIGSLSDCNWTQIQNHLVHKQALNHLTSLVVGSSPVAVTKGYPMFSRNVARFTSINQ